MDIEVNFPVLKGQPFSVLPGDWNDTQALAQVWMVAENHAIDYQDLKHWAKAEGFENMLRNPSIHHCLKTQPQL